MDVKTFHGFKRRYVKEAEVCKECGKNFNAVDLKKSDSKKLHVCCDGWRDGCSCFTIAKRRIVSVEMISQSKLVKEGFQMV